MLVLSTTLSGSSAEIFIHIGGGGGSSGTGGGVQGPLRTNTAGTPGSAGSIISVSTGTFRDSDGVTKNVNTNTSGPAGTFNDSGDGATGSLSGSGNCGGDNCRISVLLELILMMEEYLEVQEVHQVDLVQTTPGTRGSGGRSSSD